MGAAAMDLAKDRRTAHLRIENIAHRSWPSHRISVGLVAPLLG
jgi:hypothetical protein